MDHTVSARSNSRRRASLALAILPIGLLSTGCQDAVFTEFRAASNDLIQAGARSIARPMQSQHCNGIYIKPVGCCNKTVMHRH